MFFCWNLRHNFFSDHRYDLFSNDIIIKIEALYTCNKLAWGSNLIFNGNNSLILSIMLEETFKLVNFLKESNGFNFSGPQERWMSKLGFLTLGPWN